MRLDMIAVLGIEQNHEPSVSLAAPERLRAETDLSCRTVPEISLSTFIPGLFNSLCSFFVREEVSLVITT